MTVIAAVPAPWEAPLTASERSLVLYGMAVAAFALVAMLATRWAARDDVAVRYRGASMAGIGVVLVAFLSYVLMIPEFQFGYRPSGGLYMPTGDAILSWAPRYMEWTVSVPLLVVELLAVSAVSPRRTARLRGIGIAAAAAMIVCGFLGGVVVGGGGDLAALWGFGLAGTACFVVLYAIVIGTVLRSLPALPVAARSPYRAAMLLLLVVWFVYPVVFGLQGSVFGGVATTTEQLLLCGADIAAKVGFGFLIHRVARVRSAADAALAGDLDVRVEEIRVDGVRIDGGRLDGVRIGSDELAAPISGGDAVGR